MRNRWFQKKKKMIKFKNIKLDKMKVLKTFAFVVMAFLFSGCPIFNNDYDFEYQTIVGTTPVNLAELNTEFDDFNSDLPYGGRRQYIYFSSNRNNSGNNFDIVHKYFDISYHEKDDIVNIDWPMNYTEEFEQKLFKLVNTESDQLGPLFLEGLKGTQYFFYAENDSGNFDIKVIHTPRLDWGTYQAQKRLFGPVKLKGINSTSDDYYPTFNGDITKMWFCSNRENEQFDIYTLQLNPEEYLYDYLNKPDLMITKAETLSGEADDKCPILFGDYMIFTSNRTGGFGGFDLYYSKRVNNNWSSPVNFGEEINTSSDEYRPFPFEIGGKNVMIFSSDRPGGKGGFDLYAVRIELK
jgi:hypothetical protein